MAVFSTTSRYTGLSGIDTESMVQAMMKVETLKYDNLKKIRQRTAWKQEAYKSQATAINLFFKSFIDISGANSLRKTATFSSVKSSVTMAGNASTAASVRAGSTATGTFSLSIQELAKSDVYKSASKVKGSIESTVGGFDVDNLEVGDNINVTLNGRTVQIKFDKDDLFVGGNPDGARLSEEQFVEKLNEKLEAAFGKQTVFNADGTPKELDGQIVTEAKVKAEFSGNILSFTTDSNNGLKVAEGSGRDTSVIIKAPEGGFKAPAEAGKYKVMGVEFEFTEQMAALENPEDKTAAYLEQLSKALAKNNVQLSRTDSGDIKLSAIGSTQPVEVSGDGLALLGISGTVKIEPTSVLTTRMGIANGASTSFDTSKSLSSAVAGLSFTAGSDAKGDYALVKINDKDIKAYANESVKDFMSRVNSSGANVKMSFDSISQTFKLEGASTGAANSIKFGNESTEDFFERAFNIDVSAGPDVKAQDSEFILNGEKYVRESNNVAIGSLALSLNEVTGEQVMKIEVSKDIDTVFDTIKGFVDAYNALIEGINGGVNQSRAKTSNYNYYEPLTDEQRSAMSDTDIANWDAKAKQGILNRDTVLSSFTAEMRSTLYKSVDLGGGKKISLYEIGITTSATVSDQGKLVIDEDKLRRSLEERGDEIEQLFAKEEEGLADRLNKIVNNTIGANGSLTRIVGSDFYATTLTNNEMFDLMKRQDDQLADLLVTLRRKEENYYAKFSRMETAVSQSSSQMAYLQSMLG